MSLDIFLDVSKTYYLYDEQQVVFYDLYDEQQVVYYEDYDYSKSPNYDEIFFNFNEEYDIIRYKEVKWVEEIDFVFGRDKDSPNPSLILFCPTLHLFTHSSCCNKDKYKNSKPSEHPRYVLKK